MEMCVIFIKAQFKTADENTALAASFCFTRQKWKKINWELFRPLRHRPDSLKSGWKVMRY